MADKKMGKSKIVVLWRKRKVDRQADMKFIKLFIRNPWMGHSSLIHKEMDYISIGSKVKEREPPQ